MLSLCSLSIGSGRCITLTFYDAVIWSYLYGQYGILKSFTVPEETPATGYGCTAVRAETENEVIAGCKAALQRKGPTVLCCADSPVGAAADVIPVSII